MPPGGRGKPARDGIAATILVQAAPTEAETTFPLNVAEQNPIVAGVVGCADFEAPNAVATVSALAGNRHLAGLRPTAQDATAAGWLPRDSLLPAVSPMIRHLLGFEALVLARHLPRFVDRHRDLSVVLDSLGKSRIAAGTLDPWQAAVARLPEWPKIICELSGMVTEARPR
jgi:L-fuconolactonase